MKKKLLTLLILISCFFLAPNNLKISAETAPTTINTMYVENVTEYKDLNNISKLAVSQDYIAYSQDNINLSIYDLQSKNTYTISNFDTIVKIKFIQDKLLIITKTKIYYTNDFTQNTSTELSYLNVSFTNLKSADIYVDYDKVFIGIVDNSTFKLYEHKLDLSPFASNPIKTIESADFNNTYLLAINNKTAYIVSKYQSGENLIPIMYIQDYSSNNHVSTSLTLNYQTIDTFYNNNQEYILTFTGENLRLLDSQCTEKSIISINEFDEMFLEVTDIDYFNNRIYISDINHNSIQTYLINEETQALITDELLICASSQEKGRFNNASSLLVYNNELIVADTDNRRLQVIKENSDQEDNIELNSSIISNAQGETPSSLNPKNMIADSKGDLFIINNTDTKGQILKYSSTTHELLKTYEKTGLTNIIDISITNNDSIYLLGLSTSNNNTLFYLTSKGIEEKTTLPFAINDNTKIKYIKSLDLFTIFNNNTLYLISYNPKVQILDAIAIQGNDITYDFNKVFVLNDNTIQTVNILFDGTNYSLEKSSTTTNDLFSNFSTIYFDIINRTMYAFNASRQCIEYFEFDVDYVPFTLSNITTIDSLKESSTLIPASISTIIYNYPFNLGKAYNFDNSIQNCFIIDEAQFEDYYRIIFNDKNTLASGFIKKTDAPSEQQYAFKAKNLNVVTINQQVNVYKYPTLLKANNSSLIIGSFPINTALTLIAETPINIDGKLFYKIKYNDNIGFIFNADVVLNESTHISYLNNANATIKSFDDSKVFIYDENIENPLIAVDNLTRVYVEKYDKNAEYSKVIYKTNNLTIIEGYVLTSNIEMDEMDTSKIIIICIIIISIILLLIIVISYIIIKKKK